VAKGIPPVQPVTEVAVAPAVPAAAPPGLQTAAAHYDRALQALRQGDWTRFGAEMQQLGKALGEPADSTHH
jgi:uncharacterized membrane protein (UPF0182 family)